MIQSTTRSSKEYAIVIKMAETLVPDVCRIIMEMVEDHHINLGRLHWKERLLEINKEYIRTIRMITITNIQYDVPVLLLHRAGKGKGIPMPINYRFEFGFWDPVYENHIHRIRNDWRGLGPDISPNYFHTRLYPDEN